MIILAFLVRQNHWYKRWKYSIMSLMQNCWGKQDYTPIKAEMESFRTITHGLLLLQSDWFLNALLLNQPTLSVTTPGYWAFRRPLGSIRVTAQWRREGRPLRDTRQGAGAERRWRGCLGSGSQFLPQVISSAALPLRLPHIYLCNSSAGSAHLSAARHAALRLPPLTEAAAGAEVALQRLGRARAQRPPPGGPWGEAAGRVLPPHLTWSVSATESPFKVQRMGRVLSMTSVVEYSAVTTCLDQV